MKRILENCGNCEFYERARSPLQVGKCIKHDISVLGFVARRELIICDDYKQKKLTYVEKMDCLLHLYEHDFNKGKINIDQAKQMALITLDVCKNLDIITEDNLTLLYELFCKRLSR